MGLAGNPAHPYNKGALCIFGSAATQLIDGACRIRKPLRRVGSRGDGRWEELPWQEAVQTVTKALGDLKVWISGIRRDQTEARAQAKILELQDNGLLKINPLLNWTKADVERYIHTHDLPSHPLLEKGFRSIGCAPCTQAVDRSEDDRAGRWAGRGKTECGLHTEMFRQKDYHAIKHDFRLNPPGTFEEKD